jgi:hypothetical protein
MALARTRQKNTVKIIIGTITAAILIANSCSLASSNKALKSEKEKVNKLQKEIALLNKENENLKNEASIKVNSVSDIKIIREDLINAIKEAVDNRNRSIDNIDVLRALNSAENRIMDEYIKVAALILTTMETESNFKYINNINKNGTSDYGIMQVNDAIIPYIKKTLGDNIDPKNNKDHNVECGAYEIYECYLKAKEKHPEDVIWWTYAYYNRGLYFESMDTWKNPNNPNYSAVHKQANVRSNKFKESFNVYYEALKSAKE